MNEIVNERGDEHGFSGPGQAGDAEPQSRVGHITDIVPGACQRSPKSFDQIVFVQ